MFSRQSPSDETKKAVIVQHQREMLSQLCAAAGTQTPLVFVHCDSGGKGWLTTVWESEAAFVDSLWPVCGGASGSTMTPHAQKKRAVQQGIADTEKALEGKGRLVIRKSGTEPVIRVMAEADDEALVEKVVTDLKDLIERAAA